MQLQLRPIFEAKQSAIIHGLLVRNAESIVMARDAEMLRRDVTTTFTHCCAFLFVCHNNLMSKLEMKGEI